MQNGSVMSTFDIQLMTYVSYYYLNMLYDILLVWDQCIVSPILKGTTTKQPMWQTQARDSNWINDDRTLIYIHLYISDYDNDVSDIKITFV